MAALDVEKIGDDLYVLRGGGATVEIGGLTVPTAGTTLALVTARGVVLVDTKRPGGGQAILDALETITDRPVTTIINTHSHFDHVGGNVEFPATVEFIAQENTAALMREMRPVTGGPPQPNLFQEHGGHGLPTRTFKDRLTLGSGQERIELHYFGPAHTSGDAWVVFPAQRVAHVGDVFGFQVVPLLDASNGASGASYPLTIAKAVAALKKDVDTVITGHYPTALAMTDLQEYGEFTRDFVEAVHAARTAGRTIDDFAKAWTMPPRYVQRGYVSMAHLRPLRADVEVIWNEAK